VFQFLVRDSSAKAEYFFFFRHEFCSQMASGTTLFFFIFVLWCKNTLRKKEGENDLFAVCKRKWQKAVRERCQRMFLRGILSAMCHVDSERNKRFLFFLPCLTDTAAISGSPLHEHSIPGYLPGSVVCFYLKNKKNLLFSVFKPTPFLRNLTLPHFLKIYYDFLSHRCYVSAWPDCQQSRSN